jgi:putative molybdopterin biosynthesis protein
MEAFVLGLVAGGYSSQEIDQALHEVLDRWQARVEEPKLESEETIRFVGSHDPIVSLIAHRFPELVPGHVLKVTFVGSIGGLIALARYGADMAGCHLWDEETNRYNTPFVQRFLPGRRVILLTLAHRRLGLIVPRDNPAQIRGLQDLARPDLRFVNRQWGAGTRVWLDTQIGKLGIKAGQIQGYDDEAATHLEVAGAIAEGRADLGLGVEAAALAYGLGFVLLATERYDLVIPAEVWGLSPIQVMARWLTSEDARSAILGLGGYDTDHTGQVESLN